MNTKNIKGKEKEALVEFINNNKDSIGDFLFIATLPDGNQVRIMDMDFRDLVVLTGFMHFEALHSLYDAKMTAELFENFQPPTMEDVEDEQLELPFDDDNNNDRKLN